MGAGGQMTGQTAGGPIEIAPGIYWVGGEAEGDLRCNPYLVVHNDTGVLIDPGSVLDFYEVFSSVQKVIPLERIKYVVLSHQDPDLCSSVPLWEGRGLKAFIATHWRASVLQKYYGLRSPFYLVNEHNWKLPLGEGRELVFLFVPYLHFPGAIATLDPQNRVLFSGDLFGAFGTAAGEGGLYAGEDYLEAMLAFHEHYMPGNDNLRPVMELLLTLDIRLIAPQHGCVIREDVHKYIRALRDLECGAFLRPVKQVLARAGGYTGLCEQVLKRLAAMFGRETVAAVFADSPLRLDPESLRIIDHPYPGSELWERLFQLVYERQGVRWLTTLEVMVRRLAEEYGISLPQVYQSALFSLESETARLGEETLRLQEINQRLEMNLRRVEEEFTRCPVTGLRNEVFFLRYLSAELESTQGSGEESSLAVAELDGLLEVEIAAGKAAAEEVLRGAVYLLEQEIAAAAAAEKGATPGLFRGAGYSLAVYFPGMGLAAAEKVAEKMRVSIKGAAVFAEPRTASLGVAALSEALSLPAAREGPAAAAEAWYRLAQQRAARAAQRGGDRVEASAFWEEGVSGAPAVLLLEPDGLSAAVLQAALEQAGFRVLRGSNGEEGLKLLFEGLASRAVAAVVAELLLPRLDGFRVREKMLENSLARDIPFFLISMRKNEADIERALELEIEHYLQKPFALKELVGLLKRRLK